MTTLICVNSGKNCAWAFFPLNLTWIKDWGAPQLVFFSGRR